MRGRRYNSGLHIVEIHVGTAREEATVSISDGSMAAGPDRVDHELEQPSADGPVRDAMSNAGVSSPWASPSARNGTPTSVRLNRARDGHVSGLWRLLLEEQWWLLRRAARFLPQRVRASPSELVVGVYQQAVKDIRKFRGSDRPAFRAWLKKILIGVTNRVVRKPHVHEEPLLEGSEPPDPRTPVEGGVAKREKVEWMNRAMGYLEDQDQEILRLHYCDGLTFEQIGAQLEQSPAALRQRAHRLLERLRNGIPLLRAIHQRHWGPVRCQAIGLCLFRAWSRTRVAQELDIPEAALVAWMVNLPGRIEDPDD
jgi:RNA polymerase sigma factor (sigma-70 family)